MVIFIELVQYAKNLGGKSGKNLVEHQIIKIKRKFNCIIRIVRQFIVTMGCEKTTNDAIKFYIKNEMKQ